MNFIKQTYQDAEVNLDLISWLALFYYPGTYFICRYWIIQPYESLFLRVFFALLAAVFIVRNRLPKSVHKYLPYYFSIVIGLLLPFFFYYMLLMNGWTYVWVISCMAAILIHVLLVKSIKLITWQVVSAVVLAYLTVFWNIGYEPFKAFDGPQIFIFIFNYVLCAVLTHRTQHTNASKVSIAKAFGAGIAHEMRNPMSAIQTSVDVLRSMVPEPGNDEKSVKISSDTLNQIRLILDNADNTLHSANETIDILLTSIDKNRISSEKFKRCRVSDVIREALISFPYRTEQDKNSVNFSIYRDFEYFGSDTLLKYTLYNLLKNAFYYNHYLDFSINIQLNSEDQFNVIRFRDNGVGIEESVIEHIFDDFYSTGKQDGFGLGLPFCRKVMAAFGGSIVCKSELNQWTEFTLYFPRYDSKKVQANKLELLKAKHVLYIGDRDHVSGDLSEWSYTNGFHYTRMHLHRASNTKSMDFDLVIVDIEKAYFQLTDFIAFENNLHFAKSAICYLHDDRSNAVHQLPNNVGATLISIQQWKRQGRNILEPLLFSITASQRVTYHRSLLQKPRSILLVDDNRSVRTITGLMLKNEGYSVDEAQHGQEALSLLRTNDYDLILLDVEMPILNGIELTHLIRESTEPYMDIVIIGYTGNNSPESISGLKVAGMNDYIVKPAEKQVLLAKIEQWCSS